MKRKNLFIPFYLEYAGCCKFGENDSRVTFRRSGDISVLVKIISDKSISISEIPTPDHYELKSLGEIENKKLVDRLRNIIRKDLTDVSMIVDSKNYNPIEYGDKNVYLFLMDYSLLSITLSYLNQRNRMGWVRGPRGLQNMNFTIK